MTLGGGERGGQGGKGKEEELSDRDIRGRENITVRRLTTFTRLYLPRAYLILLSTTRNELTGRKVGKTIL